MVQVSAYFSRHCPQDSVGNWEFAAPSGSTIFQMERCWDWIHGWGVVWQRLPCSETVREIFPGFTLTWKNMASFVCERGFVIPLIAKIPCRRWAIIQTLRLSGCVLHWSKSCLGVHGLTYPALTMQCLTRVSPTHISRSWWCAKVKLSRSFLALCWLHSKNILVALLTISDFYSFSQERKEWKRKTGSNCRLFCLSWQRELCMRLCNSSDILPFCESNFPSAAPSTAGSFL